MEKKKSRKGLIILLSILLISGMVIGGLWTYFAEIEGKFTVRQAITIDGHDFDDPIKFEQSVIAGESYTNGHELSIIGDNTFTITVHIAGRPGVDVSFTIDEVPVEFPVTLSDGDYKLEITYTFAPRLKPGNYVIIVKFGAE